MLPKSNSVPNFLFEIPQPKTKQYNLKLTNFPKIISYSEFLKSTPKATKTERREAVRSFYNTLLHK